MKNLSKEVINEYNFSYNEYNPSNNIVDGILSEKDVFDAHFILADYFISTGEIARFGVLNYNLLSSAVARQSVGFAGSLKWKDSFSKVSTLAYGLDKNHAFQDGNKRTALLCMLLALHRNKRCLICKKKDLETLLVRIAANEMEKYKNFKKFKKHGEDATIVYMANFLRKNSRIIDNNFRSMTYEEFNKKLKVYGVWLDKPVDSFIDVFQEVNENKFFGLIKSKKTIRKLQIGFPGWKRQINPKAVKSVLKATNLTSENGIDMKTFYEGAEPEYMLIEEYYEVLKRLKDK